MPCGDLLSEEKDAVVNEVITEQPTISIAALSLLLMLQLYLFFSKATSVGLCPIKRIERREAPFSPSALQWRMRQQHRSFKGIDDVELDLGTKLLIKNNLFIFPRRQQPA